jgi:beta-aspartyl-peptidase (threonine type)
MSKRASAVFVLLWGWQGSVAGAPLGPIVDEVRKVLDQQVAAWNRKDLEGYMAGYWRSPELTFYGGSSVTRGWQATLDRYRQRYQSEGKEMGKLDFAELVVEPLGDAAALARGRWHLSLSGGRDLQGLFTVLLRRFPEGWRIVHDHSS